MEAGLLGFRRERNSLPMNLKEVVHHVVCDTESNVVFCENIVASVKREDFDEQHSNCQHLNDF